MDTLQQHTTTEIYGSTSLVLNTRIGFYPVESVKEFLIYLKTVRWHAIASETEIMDIWEKIREDAWVTDFMMDIASELNYHLTINGQPGLPEIGEIVGRSFDLLRSAEKSSCVDGDFKARLANIGLEKFFQNNLWLTAGYLISRVDISLVLRKLIENIPKKNDEK